MWILGGKKEQEYDLVFEDQIDFISHEILNSTMRDKKGGKKDKKDKKNKVGKDDQSEIAEEEIVE